MPNSATADQRPYLVYIRDPATGLLVSDGLVYRGERLAQREARKITRVLGLDAEARPAGLTRRYAAQTHHARRQHGAPLSLQPITIPNGCRAS